MLIKFGDTIVNLDNVTVVEYEPNDVSVTATVPGGSSSASASASLVLRFTGGGDKQGFQGKSAERLWAKIVSLAETVAVPPDSDQGS